MNQNTYSKALTIAGSDSGGGAGIQADLKTFSALGCYGSSVIVALTAQNTTSVNDIHQPDPEFTRAQLRAVLDDIGSDAVKIGMLFSTEIINVVAEELKRYDARNIVLDTVMVAKSGDKLLQDNAKNALVEQLMPLADIITPNVSEAEVLLERKITTYQQMEDGARDLLNTGANAVMLKGGHLHEEDKSRDCLVLNMHNQPTVLWFDDTRIDTPNTHGTGCTYSSAIAAGLAKGLKIEDAVSEAKKYIAKAIRAGAGYKLGKGHGPVHHFHEYWN